MILHTGTFLDNDFIASIKFLSLVYEEVDSCSKKYIYYFTMGYLDNSGKMSAFKLIFDTKSDAEICRKEILEKIKD